MKKLLILTAFAALAAAGIFTLTSGDDRIAVVAPVRGPAVQAVYATGTVEPSVMLPIAPRVSARLMSLTADEGHAVKKDQVLAQLEDSDLQKTLEELTARADFAARDFERKSELFKKGFVTKQNVDKAESDMKAAQAAVEQAKAQLGFLQLKAPEDGVIIRRDGEIGQLVAAQTPVFWLSCCAPLRIAAEVDEEDIALVKPGQEVIIRADAFPGQIFKGKVAAITPKGDPVARSYRVRIGLEGDTPLMTGMTAETNIIIGRDDKALLIPATALKDGSVVYTVKDGRAVATSVKTGARGPAAVAITEGVSDQDTVVKDASLIDAAGQEVTTARRDWKPE